MITVRDVDEAYPAGKLNLQQTFIAEVAAQNSSRDEALSSLKAGFARLRFAANSIITTSELSAPYPLP